MKKNIFLCLIVLIGINHAEAQKLNPWDKPQDKGQLHFDSTVGVGGIDTLILPSHKVLPHRINRLQISEPPYGLTKVKNLAGSLQALEDKPYYKHKISPKQKLYKKLSLREKFTYNMIFPESFGQPCFAMPKNIDEEDTKISAELPIPFGELYWSRQQISYFSHNRDSVIAFLKDCVAKGLRVGVNFKQVFVDINAKELIPVIIGTYHVQNKDLDILTVLMLLMKNSGYKPFLASSLYKTLYAGDDASYKSTVDWTAENEALIIKLATDFYNGLGN